MPNASYRALLVSPNTGHNYRYANALSRTQFEKYQKRGYDITVTIVNAKTEKGMKSPGRAYWNANAQSCCPSVMDFGTFQHAGDVVPSAATSVFLRLQRLWETGGAFLDFFAARPKLVSTLFV